MMASPVLLAGVPSCSSMSFIVSPPTIIDDL
jgi:hypothetical protein